MNKAIKSRTGEAVKPTILPGSKVLVFDHRLFKDDGTTPLSMTMQSATVICRYGYRYLHVSHCYDDYGRDFPEVHDWKYPDCVDVIFDRDGYLSKGHFTLGVEEIQ